MPQITATVAAEEGLHARPAALFARAVAKCGEKVMISTGGGEPVDAASTLTIMTLGVKCGDTVTLSCDVEGSEDILADLKTMLETPES